MTVQNPAAADLRIRNLRIAFRRRRLPAVRVLNGVDLQIGAGETLGIIGESASGKSTLALAILRLLDPHEALVESGEIFWQGRNLLELNERAMRLLRGRQISMIFQDPMTALDPLIPVGRQVVEVIRAHRSVRAAQAYAEAAALLARVGLTPAIAGRRPYELSGGQRQRALISMAIANRPQLIIADEPTTALDATVQAEVLSLIRELSREVGAAVLLITHDLGVIARMADRVAVMYAGQIVETGSTADIFLRPRMPYTWGLLQSAPLDINGPRVVARAIPGAPPSPDRPPSGCRFHPRCAQAERRCREHSPELLPITPAHAARCHFAGRENWRPPDAAHELLGERSDDGRTLLRLRGIRKVFGRGERAVTAVDGVDLDLARGEILAVVGESGSGKTTLGKIIVRLAAPTAGAIVLDGEPVDPRDRRALQAYHRRVQMVFQDPYSSLNPRMKVLDAVAEPRRMLGESRQTARQRAGALLERCGLPAGLHRQYPHQFSGGQRQRVGIARALVLEPQVVVLDEPVSALDVSIQAQILELLRRMRSETDTSFIFISHDLAVVCQLSDRTAVMSGGRIVEVAQTGRLFREPRHAYTKKLLAAVALTASEVPCP